MITYGINIYNSTTENTYTRMLTSVALVEKTTYKLSPYSTHVNLDPIETEVDLKVNCHFDDFGCKGQT